jgi:diguanylate cyclase
VCGSTAHHSSAADRLSIAAGGALKLARKAVDNRRVKPLDPRARAGPTSRLASAFGSLKLRIGMGSIAALTLGIGLVTALLVRQADTDTMLAQSQREQIDATHTADVLSQRAVDLQRALQATAAQLDADTLVDDDRLAAFMEAKPVLRGMFSNVFAAEADGRMRIFVDAAGARRPVLNLADRDYFKRTLAEARPVISPPLPGRVSGEPVIIFTYPLRRAGSVYGVIGGGLRLQSRDLIDTLVGSSEAQRETLVVVTDSAGKILAHPSRALLMQPLSAEPRLSAAYAKWQSIGSPVEPEGLQLGQAPEIVSAAGAAGPDWMVWRALPQASVLGPLHEARRQALAWAAAVVSVLALLLWGMLWWLLRPLTQLEHRALHLFASDRDPNLGWPDSSGEIGRVARVLRHVGAERVRLESVNHEVLQKLSSVMSAAPVGIAFTRAQCFELVSVEFCRLLGRGEAELLGQPALTIFASNAAYQALGPQVAAAFAAGQPYVGEQLMLRADGTQFWAALRGRPVATGEAQAATDAGTIWTLHDITAQVAARADLQWSALHDGLTGLANRRCFEQATQRVFAAQPVSLPAALVMIDLDHFKPVNDSAGHAAGDAMLIEVARAIGNCVRTTDLAARLGGDEFAVLLEGCDIEVALRVAEQVRAAVSAIVLHRDGHVLRVGASLGVAAIEPGMASATAWAQVADAACYAAKAEGRDVVRRARQPAHLSG